MSGRWTAIAALLGCLVAAGCSADATGGSVPAGPSTGALHASDPHASGSSHATAPPPRSAGAATTSQPGGQGSTSTAPPPLPDPLRGVTFWVNPASPAAREVRIRRGQGKQADAAQLTKIADQPTAVWLGSWAALAGVPAVLSQAHANGTTPVFVAYFIPDRDCGGASGGGAAGPADYQHWIGSLAHKLGSSVAVVVLEPDAVPMMSPGGCAESQFPRRSALLADAVHTLKSLPGVTVYLDAGHPAWPSDPTQGVATLEASGLAEADGFALNISNFQSTQDDLSYGHALSALVGGKHFVVDTGRNGAGPLPPNSGYRGPIWCNPPGRALGPDPTSDTGDALADAYLWIKYPGESDGSCGIGDQPAGTWLPDYAIGLARRSQD